jgi:uncharacterized repeat protein (TIGR03803 family)
LHSYDGNLGQSPMGTILIVGNTIYGTTYIGGDGYAPGYGYGTVYSVKTDGSDYTILKNFENGTAKNPKGGLIMVDSTLYGMTYNGGDYGYGCIFAVDTDGTDYKQLFSFRDPNGSNPSGSLTLFHNALYGMASGGTAYNGVIFRYVLSKSTPVINWENPADINYGTLLSSVQLNAKTNASGTFVYTPATGTKLGIGRNQLLKVEFIPDDTVAYYSTNKTVSINVLAGTNINETESSKIEIYPNPVSKTLNIKSDKQVSSIEISGCNGVIMYQSKEKFLQKEILIENFPKGLYILKIKTSKGIMIHKIVKN